jgi:hypothetical protein
MKLALVLFLAAAVVPVFLGKTRSAPFWLAVQALALAWVALVRQGGEGGHALAGLAELLLVRGVIAPLWLRRAMRRRGEPSIELLPSNLFVWAIAIALLVLAFGFGAPELGDARVLALGAVAATVAVALLLLAANDAPPAQLTAVLVMENAIALFESQLPEPWPLPVHLALSAVYLLTVGVGAWLIARPEAPALGAAPAGGHQ